MAVRYVSPRTAMAVRYVSPRYVSPLRQQCLPAKHKTRRLFRSEHADAADRHRQHMASDQAKAEIAHRSALCEHPFGTIKRWMGWDHFLVRGFEKASGELGLMTHCYNLKRVLSLFGIRGFVERCRQLRAAAAEQQEGIKRCFFAYRVSLSQTLWEAVCAFGNLTLHHNPLAARRAQRPLKRAVAMPAGEFSGVRPALNTCTISVLRDHLMGLVGHS